MASLLESFEAAVEANSHITDVDAAAVQAGRSIATVVDRIVADDNATPTEIAKTLYLVPHLIGILKELLATPLARKQVGLAAADTKKASRLSLIQEAAGKKAG